MQQVNFERLKQNILTLSSIGREEGGGIYRMAFTQEDVEARKWLLQQLESAGIEGMMDGALNVIGRLNGGQNSSSVVIGSHLDTVPNAGALDGALGVLMALECLQRVREEKITLKYPLELIGFSDEEGRFGGMFGSRSFSGMMTPGYLEEAADLDNIRLKDVLEQLGNNPYAALDAARPSEEIRYYLEVHIEQGPVLDRQQCPLGIVTDITGLFKWQIIMKGASNHAGTTPMELRQDALMGLADFAHEIPRIISENGSDHTKMTIGKVNLLPGSPNTIPGEAIFSLDVRDTSANILRELQQASRKVLSSIARQRDLMFTFEELSWIEPVSCDSRLIDVLEKSAHVVGRPFIRMPSGAAHDAQMVAGIAPVGMLFVPSKGGVSHSPHEWTDWQDIEIGANVLLNAIVELNEATG